MTSPRLLIIYGLLTLTTVGQTESIEMWLFSGQSNMNGTSTQSKQVFTADPIDGQIRYSWGKGWGPLRTRPTGARDNPFQQWGVESYVTRGLAKAGRKIAAFKQSHGGTSIVQFGRAGSGGRLDSVLKNYLAAAKQLEDEGHTVLPRGFVWIQGETGVDYGETEEQRDAVAAAYGENLKNLISDVREALGAPELQVYTLFNENFRRFDDTAHTARSDNVIAGHKAVAAEDSRVHYFSSVNDFPKDNPLTTTDGTHYDAAGLKRISDAILAKELASSEANDGNRNDK